MKAVYIHRFTKRDKLKCSFDMAANEKLSREILEEKANREVREKHDWFLKATRGRLGRPRLG